MHNLCAIAFVLAPELFAGRRRRIEVVLAGSQRGRAVVAPHPANALLLGTIDLDGFFALLGEALARLS